MQLIHYPNPILLQPCKTIYGSTRDQTGDQTPKNRSQLATAMWKIMDDHNGIGLAAPQVGLNIRMFVWKKNGCNLAIWNPVFTWLSGEANSIEGCLSLPGIQVTIKRATQATLSGTDYRGWSTKNKPIYARGIGEGITIVSDLDSLEETRIWQHEIDHLNGQLIIDNMSREDTITNRDALRTLLKNAI
jgi:peptide deformylase